MSATTHSITITLTGGPDDETRVAKANPPHVVAKIKETIAFHSAGGRALQVKFIDGSPFSSQTIKSTTPKKCVNKRATAYSYECYLAVGEELVFYPFDGNGGDVKVGG